MNPGPRIIASQAIHDLCNIDDTWKIAAVEAMAFGHSVRAWEWLCGANQGQEINRALYNGVGRPRTLSGVQGWQRWDGADRWVLYVRKLPPGARA